jgi:hypothetical protein
MNTRREHLRAIDWLSDALLDARPRLPRVRRGQLAKLLEKLRSASLRHSRPPERELSRVLATSVADSRTARDLLTDRLRYAGRYLAPDGRPPQRGARSVAWRALVLTAARLHASRVRRLPRPLVELRLLDRLKREGAARQPRGRPRRTHYATPGPVLTRLAVDRRLQRVASKALGMRLAPAGVAVYIYDPPRSHVPPHLDSEAYEVIVHIVLEHVAPAGARRSALVVHRPDHDQRIGLRVGAGVALAGRGAVHQWEPLGSRERRMLVGIGFKVSGA